MFRNERSHLTALLKCTQVLHPEEMVSQLESLLGQYLKQLLEGDISLFIRNITCDNKLTNVYFAEPAK